MRVVVPVIDVERRQLSLARRLPALDGVTIGFFDSYVVRDETGRIDMYPLMGQLAHDIAQRFSVAGVVWERRPSIARPADAAQLDAFAAQVGAAIVGECASGVSAYATVHDAVELESRGVPTITICHSQLEAAATRHTEDLGMPGLPLLIEPAASTGVVRAPDPEHADASLDAVIQALVQDRKGEDGSTAPD